MRPTGEPCPKCGQAVPAGKWVCRCGQIIQLDILRHQRPADRLVFDGDLSADEDGDTPTNRIEPENQSTVRFDPIEALGELFMGRVIARPSDGAAGLLAGLNPIEIFVLSLIDGKRSAAEIIEQSRLKKVELSVILLNLLRSGSITTDAAITVETQGGAAEWGGSAVEYQRHELDRYEQSLEGGDVTSATFHLKRSVALRPDPKIVETLVRHLDTVFKDCDAFYNTARYHLSMDETARAIEVLERAIEEFPGEAGFLNLLAVTIVKHNGDKQDARRYLERAIALDPNNDVYSQNISRLA